MNTTALYYEVHISILGGESVTTVRQLVKKFCPEYHVSEIVGDEPDIIVTSRHKTFNMAIKSMVQTLSVLQSYDVIAARHKIEIAVIDSLHVETSL